MAGFWEFGETVWSWFGKVPSFRLTVPFAPKKRESKPKTQVQKRTGGTLSAPYSPSRVPEVAFFHLGVCVKTRENTATKQGDRRDVT